MHAHTHTHTHTEHAASKHRAVKSDGVTAGRSCLPGEETHETGSVRYKKAHSCLVHELMESAQLQSSP